MIEPQTLVKAVEIVAASDDRAVEVLAATLRAELDMIVFTCSEDDICGVKPLAQTLGVNLYLLSSNGGCLSLARDPEMALGLVLAEVTGE